MRRLVLGGTAVALILGGGGGVAALARSGSDPGAATVTETVPHRPDTVRFDATRDCPGPSTSAVVDYLAGGGAPTRDQALRPVLAEFERAHGPVTLHRFSGDPAETGSGEIERVDDADGVPVGEISLYQTGPDAWQVPNHTMCATSWVGDGRIPTPEELRKDGGGRKVRIESWSAGAASDRVKVRFTGAPRPASRRCGQDYLATVAETPTTVTITVVVRRVDRSTGGCTDVGGRRHAVADLTEPLGIRKVLDGVTHRPIPPS